MNKAELIMLSIIDNKIDHAQDHMDQGDLETARQVHEEIQEFIQYMAQGNLSHMQADTKEQQSELFDAIVTRELF